MKRALAGVFAIAGAVSLTALVSGLTAQTRTGAPQAGAEALARGQAIANNGAAEGAVAPCVTCHGADGAGDASAGFPRLAGLNARYMAKQLRDYAEGARPNEVMAPIAKQLSQDDWIAVSQHYALMPLPQPDGTPASAGSASPRELSHGATLYAQGLANLGVQACSNCHGPQGIGQDPAYPRIGGQHASYVAAQLRLWREDTRKNDPARVMREVSKRLGDSEIDAVAKYLASLRP